MIRITLFGSTSRTNQLVFHKNIYFGPESVLKLPDLDRDNPAKMDTITEFLAVTYALFNDFLIGNYVLTHYTTQRGNPVVIPLNSRTLNGRVRILFLLLRKHPELRKYNTDSLKKFIQQIANYIKQGKRGIAEAKLLQFAQETGTLDLYYSIRRKILEKKSQPALLLRQ